MTPPLIYLIAGEPSGDLLGARLMAGLKTLLNGEVRFAGVGGEAMREQGLDSLFMQKDIAVMGLAEVLPHIPTIMNRLSMTIDDIERKKPNVIVTIDSWGFTGRIAERLKERGSSIPRVHYVAPMVWAWREKRVKQLADRVDFLMCLLPNEPPMFEKAGLSAAFVGHSVLEGGADQGDGDAFRRRFSITDDKILLAVLPGSRHSEVSRLLPEFEKTIGILAQKRPDLQIVIPTVETVADEVREKTAHWPAPVLVIEGRKERYDAFAASRAALAASGTAALELAMAGLPMIIAYKVAPLTGFLARLLVKVRYVCLLNLLCDKSVVPEFLQEDCRADLLAPALDALIDEGETRALQLKGIAEALALMGREIDEGPSLIAARHVLRYALGEKL